MNREDTGGSSTRPTIACVGLGYVGYHSALAFVRSDYPVVGVDTDEDLIDAIVDWAAPFEAAQLAAHIERDSCTVTPSIEDAADASVYVISVPTPIDATDAPDLSAVRSACRDVATVLAEGDLVVVQSTVYPGCVREELIPELERSGLIAGSDVGVSHVPERYSPGSDRSTSTPRVVGSITDEWRTATEALYDDVTDRSVPVSSIEAAEATKLLENAQRDVNIAVMNEFAVAADSLGVDVWEVIDGAATKWNFLPFEPGFGVGGHCLPVDPHYLRWAAEQRGAALSVIPSARSVNDSMPAYYSEKILGLLESVGKAPTDATVAVLGVTYKPNVRDVRNSPGIDLVDRLGDKGCRVDVFDTQFDPGEPIADTGIENGESVIAVVSDSDVLAVVTNHDLFATFEPATLARSMAEDPILVDPRRAFDPDAVAASPLRSGRPERAAVASSQSPPEAINEEITND